MMTTGRIPLCSEPDAPFILAKYTSPRLGFLYIVNPFYVTAAALYTAAIGRFTFMPPHPGDFTAATRSNTFLQIEGAGNSLTGLLLPPPAKGTTSADWRPYQSHRTGPLGLQNPSRFLRKYLTPTFIALQSWHCFADLRIFSRSLFRGRGVWRSQLTEVHPSSEYDVPKCWYSIFKVLRRAFYLPFYSIGTGRGIL